MLAVDDPYDRKPVRCIIFIEPIASQVNLRLTGSSLFVVWTTKCTFSDLNLVQTGRRNKRRIRVCGGCNRGQEKRKYIGRTRGLSTGSIFAFVSVLCTTEPCIPTHAYAPLEIYTARREKLPRGEYGRPPGEFRARTTRPLRLLSLLRLLRHLRLLPISFSSKFHQASYSDVKLLRGSNFKNARLTKRMTATKVPSNATGRE